MMPVIGRGRQLVMDGETLPTALPHFSPLYLTSHLAASYRADPPHPKPQPNPPQCLVLCSLLCFAPPRPQAEMETDEGGEEGISAAVHTQMQQKWKELSKKRCGGAGRGMSIGSDGGSVPSVPARLYSGACFVWREGKKK